MNDGRTQSFGQGGSSFVDRFGVWLSRRHLRRVAPDFRGLSVGDFGCGFEAMLTKQLVGVASHVTLVDVAVSGGFKSRDGVRVLEGYLPEVLCQIDDVSLDVVLCVSVLEHLWDPLLTLREIRRVLRPGGVVLVNVPTWRGKKYLEFSAFRLGLSPAAEMDDHKAYYDPKDLWPLIVQSGFAPHAIKVRKHKFGLNCYAIARVDREPRAPLT